MQLDARDMTAVAVACVAMVTDLRSGKVRNVLTIPAILLGFALNGLLEGDAGLLRSLQGLGVSALLLGLSVGFGGALGGGDIKLLAAIGALGGPVFLITAFCIAAPIGGVIAGVVAARHRQFIASCTRCFTWIAFKLGTGTAVPLLGAKGSLRVPYAVAIAGGVIGAVAWRATPLA